SMPSLRDRWCRRNLEVVVLNADGVQRVLRRLRGKVHADAGLVFFRMLELTAERRVVNLEDDHRAGGDFLGRAGGPHVEALAGRVAGEQQPEGVAAFCCRWRSEERRVGKECRSWWVGVP